MSALATQTALVPENQQQYGSILTIEGEVAEQNSKLLKQGVEITHIAFGDANDTYIQPSRTQTGLVNEIGRLPVNSVDVMQATPESVPMLRVEAIVPPELYDIVIREHATVATFNGNTFFHAVGNCARVYVPPPVNNGNMPTPVTLEMFYVITSAEAIVEIEARSVHASREWVYGRVSDSDNRLFGGNIHPQTGSLKQGDKLPYSEAVNLNGRTYPIIRQDGKFGGVAGEVTNILSVTTIPEIVVDGIRCYLADIREFKKTELSINALWADETGKTYSTASMNAAITVANARGGIDASRVSGTTIKARDGDYKLGRCDPIKKSGINVAGESDGGTRFILDPDCFIFTWGDGITTIVAGGLRKLKLEYEKDPVNASSVVLLDKAFRTSYEELQLVNIQTLLTLGMYKNRVAGGSRVSNVKGFVFNSGFPLFKLNYGAGLYISECNIFVGGVHPPKHPEQMTTKYGTDVLGFLNGNGAFWDTALCGDCIFERFDRGLRSTATSGVSHQNITFSNVVMDYFRRWCIYGDSQLGGIISNIIADDDCWFVSWETDAIYLTGEGYNDGHNIKGRVPIAGLSALNYRVKNANKNKFDLSVANCNRLGTAQGALFFHGGSRGFDVKAVGNFAAEEYRAPYGIVVGSDCDDYLVDASYLDGPEGGYLFNPNSKASANRIAGESNRNRNYAGHQPFTMPESEVEYINMTPFIQEFDFFGGVLTSGYSKNDIGFPGHLPYFRMILKPGDKFKVGYAEAPTVIMFQK